MVDGNTHIRFHLALVKQRKNPLMGVKINCWEATRPIKWQRSLTAFSSDALEQTYPIPEHI
jgi:hypothetical protein